jgi:tetratricopeptide (TPR) repeat protein
VAWIAERKDVLSAFFGLLALWAYASYAHAPSVWRYLSVAAALALSLISKPMFVTVPFLLLVLDWWPLGRFSGRANVHRLFAEKLPLFGLVAVSSCITYRVQQQEGAVMPIEDSPLLARIANGVISYAAYLRQTIWPSGLAALYPHPGAKVPVEALTIASLVLVSITLLCIVLRGRAPYLVAGWLWYLGTLVPVIGLVQVGTQARADRYTYFPQIGVLIAICWGVAALLKRRPRLAGGIAAAAVTALVVTTSNQIAYWRNSLTLWQRALAAAGESATTCANLGETLEELGKVEEATNYYRRSLALAPASIQAHINLGCNLQKRRLDEEAATVFADISRVAPQSPAGHMNLGLLLQKQKRYPEAADEFAKASELGSDEERAHAFLSRGSVEEDRGRFDVAEGYYRDALRLQPGSAQAYTGLGVALLNQGQDDKGLAALRQALALDSESEAAHAALGKALVRRREFDEAAGHLEYVTRTSPAKAIAWFQLGFVRAQQGRNEDAAVCYANALERDARLKPAWSELTRTLQQLRKAGQADFANQIEQRVLPLLSNRSDAASHPPAP